jgi:hypothetical protein
MFRQNLTAGSEAAGNMGVQLKVICAVKAAQEPGVDTISESL